jgi:cysteine desulfuration protein SufE
MVKGLVHFLCAAYSGATPTEIATTEPTFLDELGLLRDLSPTRRNGLTAVGNRIRELARATPSNQPEND